MNNIKFYHPVTGKLFTARFHQGIMKLPDGEGHVQKRCYSLNKFLAHMWQQGYVRCGKGVALTDLEKKMIEMAPAFIEKLKSQLADQQAAAVEAAKLPLLPRVGVPDLAFSRTEETER